jgi:ubiquinone/menaquinone biosynthesis C-methylase UbiE
MAALSKFDAAGAARMERMYSSPPIVAQRAWTRSALALKPGERGLEIGCGVGFLACEMAREVSPDGRIACIDNSPAMIAAARARAEREGVAERMQFSLGDAVQLVFPSASFDFVVAVQVYLYVSEIERALAEAARVLRPDGRMVIVDTDWDSCVWLTGDRERHKRIQEARLCEFGQPHLPPALPRLLQSAGMELVKVQALPIVNLRYDSDSFSAGLADSTPKIVTQFGISPAEADAWLTDLKSRTGDGDYFFSLNRYMFVARPTPKR